VVAAAPTPALAHDAFGDLGPFYASLLHPLADPLQAALVAGMAAFLASRPLGTAQVALPVFVVSAALGLGLLGWWLGVVPSPLLPAAAAIVVGLAAMVPARWTPLWTALPLAACVGTLAGLAPDWPPQTGALQPLVGGLLGIGIFTALGWAGLDALARRLSPIAPAVAGSWVAAIGMLAGAFAFQPMAGGDTAARVEGATGQSMESDQ
jgi:hypothetical protein